MNDFLVACTGAVVGGVLGFHIGAIVRGISGGCGEIDCTSCDEIFFGKAIGLGALLGAGLLFGMEHVEIQFK